MNNIEELKYKVSSLKDTVKFAELEKSLLEEQRDELTQKLNDTSHEVFNLQAASALLELVSSEAKEHAKALLESVVTSILQHVFETDISFEIELTESRGRTEAEFYIVTNMGDQVVRAIPQDSAGGGVVDIVSMALRVAFLRLYTDPVINGPIILDEPGKHVSEEFSAKMAGFLKEIGDHFKRQIIIVTHEHDLAAVADRAFQVEIIGDKSKVTNITQEKKEETEDD